MTVARKVATFNGINTIGSVSMLVWAKGEGLVPEIGPILTSIRQTGIYLSETVLQEALQLAGE